MTTKLTMLADEPVMTIEQMDGLEAVFQMLMETDDPEQLAQMKNITGRYHFAMGEKLDKVNDDIYQGIRYTNGRRIHERVA